ncbi:MAG: hypothetical protein EOP21_05155, partial [Hyphomicrobiales bacterium]
RTLSSSPRRRGSSNPRRKLFSRECTAYWIPAFAGMTRECCVSQRPTVAPLSHESRARTVVLNQSGTCIIFANRAAERR